MNENTDHKPKRDPKFPIPHKVVLTIRQTAAGIKVECQPPFAKLAELAKAKTMAPVEAYAWDALRAMRELSAAIAAAQEVKK